MTKTKFGSKDFKPGDITKKIKGWLSEAVDEVKEEEKKKPMDSETLMYLGGKVVAHKKDLLLILKCLGEDPKEVIDV